MIEILKSFACGLAFGMGVFTWFAALQFCTERGRNKLKEQAKKHYDRVENRLAAQVSAMLACLEEIKKSKEAGK